MTTLTKYCFVPGGTVEHAHCTLVSLPLLHCMDDEASAEKAISHQCNVINTWSASNITQPRVKADCQWQGRKKKHHGKPPLYKVWRLKVRGRFAKGDHFSLLLLQFKIRSDLIWNRKSCVRRALPRACALCSSRGMPGVSVCRRECEWKTQRGLI